MNQRAITDGGPEGIHVLNDLAELLGAKTKGAKVMLADGLTLTRRLRAVYQRHAVELHANQDLVLVDVEAHYGEFTLLQINPRVKPSHRPRACSVQACSVNYHAYSSAGTLSQAQSSLVESGVLKRLLEAIRPDKGEEINISQRLVRVYIRRPTTQRVMGVIHAVIELMPHQTGWKERSAYEELPDTLRSLIPLVAKWAIPDDEGGGGSSGAALHQLDGRSLAQSFPWFPP